MVAEEAWRARATSGVGARETALPLSLRCDLFLCYYCMMSYSVLILSTTVAILQRRRPSLHRHYHPSRAVAAVATAAAAVWRLLCSVCG